jgi:hypothetical protein
MGRGARREVGVEGRLSVVRQRGQEDDKGVTKQRTMVFESLGVGMLLWPGAPGGQVPRNQRANAQRKRTGPRALRTQIAKTGEGRGFSQEHMEQTQCPCQEGAKSPSPPRRQRNAGEAHRAQSAPRGALRGEIRGNHLGEGLGKLGICRR